MNQRSAGPTELVGLVVGSSLGESIGLLDGESVGLSRGYFVAS